MQAIRLVFLVFFSGLAGLLPAQDLLTDGQNLLDALKTMEDSTASPEAAAKAAQDALLILYLYDQPTQIEAPEHIAPTAIIDDIAENPLLRGLVNTRQDSLLRLVAPAPADTAQWARLQTPNRRRISALMYTGAALSPRQFLSVKQSMLDSQAPPLQNDDAMRSAADKIQDPPSTSPLRAEAILEGLFAFILERAEQEVAVTFFENLLDKKIPEVGWLFPNVRERYSNPNITYSQSFLENLREAFFLDLKNLNLTLPELLLKDEYFGELQRDPIFYNLLTVYTIFGLSHEMPLSEAIPLTHRDLYRTYQSAEHSLNLHLATTADSTGEYGQVIAASTDFIAQLKAVYVQLETVENDCETRIDRLEKQYPQAPPSPDRRQYLANPLYTLQVLLGNSEVDSLPGYDLALLPQLLRGSFDSATLVSYNTLEDYDKFFNPPHDNLHWRIAGLELARNLNGNWYNDMGLIEIVERWQTDLADYEKAVDRWQAGFDTLSVEEAIAKTDTQRVALQQLTAGTRAYWSGAAPRPDLQSLLLLEAVAGPGNFEAIDFDDISPAEKLLQRRELLFQIEIRLKDVDKRLAEKYPSMAAGSPFQAFLASRRDTANSSAQILGGIEILKNRMQALQTSLNQLDARFAPQEQKAWENTRPLLQLTELLSHLFYAFQTPGGIISLDSLDKALFEPALRDACLGLLQQRMSRVQNAGWMAPEETAQLARMTLQDLLDLQKPLPGDTSSLEKQQQRKLFRVLSVALQLLDRGLEYPLFADPAKPFTYVPLTTRFPGLKPLPEISSRCMNFLYYLEIGEHRSAVSALVRLLTVLSRQIDGQNPGGERNVVLDFFEDYGDFIAGMVDAKSRGEVENLLKSLADPPGSSRTKRTKRLTVSLNSYVGASAGVEFWQRKPQSETLSSNFASLAPNIPIGFTVSKLFGLSNKHPQSFSLHVSVLDLGAMMTYRLAPENEFGSYKLTFKNVFKPGLQAQWNIQNSPFYLGLGWQTGAQFQTENGEEITFRSSRFFLAFGVDVPIKTLYQR